jgi:signal transduction histidine kinase
LWQLNLRPQSSQRTLIQALDLLCRTFDVDYGLIGRLNMEEDQLETVALYTRDGRDSEELNLKQKAMRSVMSHSKNGLPCKFRYISPTSKQEFVGIGLPLISQGELIGLLILLNPHAQAFNMRPHLESLQEASGFFSLVMVNMILATQSLTAEAELALCQMSANVDKTSAIQAEIRSFSHDIRNPLSAVMTCSDLLANHADMIPPERLEQLLEILNRSTRQSIDLLDDFQQRMLLK